VDWQGGPSEFLLEVQNSCWIYWVMICCAIWRVQLSNLVRGDFEWYVQLGEECVEMHKDHNQHLVVLGQLVAAQIWCLDGLSHGGT